MIRMAVILAASLVYITSAQTADQPKESPAALERKLHGEWKGGPCEGDWTFAPDGTYKVKNYSPGNNKLTGTWEVRWNALPPTLVRTCKTSDAPDRIKVGEKTEVKLIQLDDNALAYQYLSQHQQPGGHTNRFKRVTKDPETKIEQPVWGKPSNGLRLGLYQTDPKGDGKPRLTIVIENAGTEDIFLLLGHSFGLGKKHDLESVRLRLTDSDGRQRVLLPKPHKRDDEADGALVTLFALQLVADGRYAVTRDLTDFYDPDDVDAVLPAGRYRAKAEFVGSAPTKEEAGSSQAFADLARMHFWTGTIQSDECPVTLPAKPAK